MSMSEYKKLTKRILKQIEKKGFCPTDIKFDSGYFIFEHEKDSVVKFHIKECKGWLFGIWWSKDDYIKCEFFTQYEDCIDKFKPSASVLVMNETLYDTKKTDIEYISYEFVDLIEYIKKFPYKAWYRDVFFGYDIWQEVSGFEAWKEYIEYRIKRAFEKRLSRYLHERCRKLLQKIADEVLIEGVVQDEWKNDFVVYPRFLLRGKNFKKNRVEEKGFYEINENDLSPKLRKEWKKYQKVQEKWRRYNNADALSNLGVLIKGEKC